MDDQFSDRRMAELIGAHLVALSKAMAVYQAELAKIFLGMAADEEREEAGPMYKTMREFEKLGFASSMFDQSDEGAKRRFQSWTGANAALAEGWMNFMSEPWRSYMQNLATSPGDEDDES